MSSDLYDKAFAAYRALCDLEDELDAMAPADRRPTEAALNELRCLRSRWIQDTVRKVDRALETPAAVIAIEGVEPDGTIPMYCSACGKPKPDDRAWPRPAMGCECGSAKWVGTVTFRG